MKRPVLGVVIMFVLGEVSCKYSSDYSLYVLAGVIISALILVMRIRTKGRFEDTKSRLFVLILITISFIAGYLLHLNTYQKHINAFPTDYNREINMEKLDRLEAWEGYFYVVGRVIKITEKESGIQYVLSIEGEKVLLNVYEKKDDSSEAGDEGESQAILQGQTVEVIGIVEGFDHAENPGGFDKKDYYEAKGIFYELKNARIVKVYGRANYLKLTLNMVKKAICKGLDNVLSEKEAGIMKTMITGDNTDLDEEIKLLYQKNGIAHILAISGLHAALVGKAILFLLRVVFGFSAKKSGVGGMILIVIYAAMTGFSPATVRAVVMLCVIYLGDIKNRSADTLNSLSIAYLIIILFEPFVIFQSGFQMSVAAVFGTAASDRIFNKLYKPAMKGHSKYYVWLIRNIIMMISINTFTLPIIINTYYEIPVYASILSMIVVLILSTAIISGLAGALISLIPFALFKAMGEIVAFPASIILRLYEILCRNFLRLPGAVYNTGHAEWWVVVIYYAVIGAGCYMFLFRKKRGEGVEKKWI